ncbi:MAG: type V CRISPR-associated protein Cas12a/Cpf1 [Flavobacteriales bacterium]|nr:type V CRISPR-associated protein Cas12a/Cpf1 [Flavobacteriales bacterium]
MNNTTLQKFTNLYQLSKTLRFELKPVGKNGKQLSQGDTNEIFKKIIEQDRKIKEAYVALKPVLDKIHEDIINKSLSSEEAKKIDFALYFEEYKKGKEKKVDTFENTIRNELGKAFEKTANNFAESVGEGKGIPIFKKNKGKHVGVAYLTQSGILKYIEKNIKLLVTESEIKEFIDEKEITNTKGKKEIKRTGHLVVLSSFFTYFSGFNQNRENYYVTKEEKATAVATRIVHENLPKFCDNAVQFYGSRKEEYLGALEFLKNNNRTTKIKDAETNTMIDAKAIVEDWFNIERFSTCLAQSEIEGYNKVIGHYNLLINLYNQAKKTEDKSFKNLQPFKTLFKQIGCGEKKALFFELKFDTKEEQQKANENSDAPLNLQETIELISKAGKKYFQKSTNDSDVTIYSLIDWLKNNTDWNGVYWSKSAVDKVSNKYFANWHEIKDRIQKVLESKEKEQKELLRSVASFDKKREEQLKINDAVELSILFSVLNQTSEESWSKSFFKESILSDRSSVIDEKLSPSENVINLICSDLQDLATDFFSKSVAVLKITDYKHEDNILAIKEWLDTAKYILWLIKYFEVKAVKVKGNNINPELTVLLDSILRANDADWLDWYDLVRNYLTKKPQDDAKKNKLKLNFENPNLAGGWSDGQEKNKGTVLLKNNDRYYLGVLISRSVFDTEKEENPIYKASDSNIGRLILKTLKFQTLAGKGFIRDYGIKYGDIQQDDDAIQKLQGFIKNNYVKKYPLLKEVSEKKYDNKKAFDKDIQDALSKCYECNYRPVNWNVILKNVADEEIYLFEIYSKDFSNKSTGTPNLQTKYWKHLFDDDSSIQLCGGGELFFREKVELKAEDKAIHPANEKIYRRSDGKKESIFKHDIVKNKRFINNKYFFHVPIKINYQAPSPKQARVNDVVNDNFTKVNDIQFLGIDRGEKHLIYYSLLDANGNIKENGQGHFDIINKKNYLQEINDAAKKRKEKQENWQQKGNIANLKDGYISLVVHEIIQKMKDEKGNLKPTFIVLEDLNTGFKRSRQKFEQSVYQKFELALAKKLNYLVDKNANDGEISSVAKALQLTPPVSNYGDIENRKQVGVMLYTRANYTSITDPVTGWRKTIYLKKGSEDVIKTEIFKTFDNIGVDNHGDYFFEYKDESTQKTWILRSGEKGKTLERYRAKRAKDKNEYIVESIDVKSLLDKLFEKFDKSKSLKQQLQEGKELPKINEHTAWETLRFIIDIIQQIRNSGDTSKGQDDNFLQSPVRNEQGVHFDSRLFEKQENPKLPKDADANGAYNIARKGIVMYEHIKQWVNDGKHKFEKGNDLDLFISDKEWDLWVSDKQKWGNEVKSFASKKAKESNTKKITVKTEMVVANE